MATYGVFNRDNGQLVHVHTEPDELQTSHDDLLKTVDPALDRDALEVRSVDPKELRPSRAQRVDPKTGRLEVTEEPEGSGGALSAEVNLEALLPDSVRIVYERQEKGG